MVGCLELLNVLINTMAFLEEAFKKVVVVYREN